MFFFFSSRRRHTRSLRDWSSDVCSSDLRIIASGMLEASVADLEWDKGSFHVRGDPTASVTIADIAMILRSEERRVGKECRSRWGTEDGEEKGREREWWVEVGEGKIALQ